MATVLMGILWKRVNYPAGLFGLVGGVLITASLLGVFSGHFGGIPKLHFFYIGGIAQVIIMLGIAAVSLLTAAPDYERIAPYVLASCSFCGPTTRAFAARGTSN